MKIKIQYFATMKNNTLFISMLKISSVKGLNSGAKIMQTCQIYAGQTITKLFFQNNKELQFYSLIKSSQNLSEHLVH